MSRAHKLDFGAFQQELATRLANKTAAQVESSRLGFAAAGQYWLVRLSDAAEVVAIPAIVPVPFTKPWLLGVANVRGNLHTIIDFAAYLGKPALSPREIASSHRLVVFGPRAGELKTGIVVERVLGLRNLAELAPGAPQPDVLPWFGEQWIDGEGGVWQEMDLTRLAHDPAFLHVGI